MVFLTLTVTLITMIYMFGGFDDLFKRYGDIKRSKSKWKDRE